MKNEEVLTKIPKDTIVLFSHGEYSDYGVEGLMKAKVDIDPNEIRNDYVSLYPDQIGNYCFKHDQFLQYLKDKDLFEELPTPNWKEWYLSSYHRITEMKVYDGPILFT